MHARRAKLKSQLVSAKAKLKHHVTPRRLLLLSAAAASAFLLLLTLRTLSAAAANTSSPAPVVVHRSQQQQRDDQCDRVPAGVAEALVHYATSNATAWGRGGGGPPRGGGDGAGGVAAGAVQPARVRARPRRRALGGAQPRRPHGVPRGGRRAGVRRQPGQPRHRGLPRRLPRQRRRRRRAPRPPRLRALHRRRRHQLSPGHFDRSPCKLAVRGLPAAFYEAEGT